MNDINETKAPRQQIGPNRRAILGGLLSASALFAEKAGGRSFPKPQAHPTPKNLTLGQTHLILKTPNAADQTLGLVVGIPQECRLNRPGGTQAYGGPEWIREVTFVKTEDMGVIAAARKTLPASRLSNGPSAVGCGHVSKNVTVVEMTPNGAAFTEQALPTLFYSMAVGGRYTIPTNLSSPFIVDNIWISTTPWDETSQEFKDATQRSINSKSSCSA